MSLTKEEQNFVDFWKENRKAKHKVFQQLAVGLPAGVFIVLAILANFFSPWYKKASMVRNQEMHQNSSSLLLVLLAAGILIVVFFVVFGAWHRWDMNEQRYKELLVKEERNKNIVAHQNL